MENYTAEEIKILGTLAEKTIEQLKTMPQPIVRVCGPLTTGGFNDYDKNAERLRMAEEILTNKGYTVFGFSDAETEIKDKNYSHAAIMELFHKKVLESGLVTEAFFLKGWQDSKGATLEHKYCSDTEKIAITDFPEDWFSAID